jgi:hypothetical protein
MFQPKGKLKLAARYYMYILLCGKLAWIKCNVLIGAELISQNLRTAMDLQVA